MAAEKYLVHGGGGVGSQTSVVAETIVLVLGILAHGPYFLLDFVIASDVLFGDGLLDLAQERVAHLALHRIRGGGDDSEQIKEFHFYLNVMNMTIRLLLKTKRNENTCTKLRNQKRHANSWECYSGVIIQLVPLSLL